MSQAKHEDKTGKKTYEAELLKDTLISVFAVGVIILLIWLTLFGVYLSRI